MKLTWTLLIVVTIDLNSNIALRFTNIKCKSFHPEFSTFEKCNLRVIGRGIIGVNIYVKLWQLPVNNVSVNAAIFKKANGYRPFLYNMSADFCHYMAHRKKYPLLSIFHGLLLKESNINHTCPYDHDIIVKDSVLDVSKLKNLPLPRGEYRFDVKVGAYNDWKAELKAYLDIGDDL
ncbi:uncharacterized protein LOC133337715 [Musca vetustissima]|uniref:uncharacterized protein LOC133337715 n=1 Tax=Musca vetustissima TaxID=27455 RepID=UPI002AB715E2|nr:uncharacterized protein LOC133337715 [Musca vetustissima]